MFGKLTLPSTPIVLHDSHGLGHALVTPEGEAEPNTSDSGQPLSIGGAEEIGVARTAGSKAGMDMMTLFQSFYQDANAAGGRGFRRNGAAIPASAAGYGSGGPPVS